MIEPKPQPSLPPKTTLEQDRRTEGQRQINLIWEYTQAGIAVCVVLSNLVYVFVLLFVPQISQAAVAASGLLSNAFFLVIGFYFGRTNHARIGDEPIDDRRK